ncbi:hypothetical protein BDV97DRAFT_347938 [Delphinella strobiligena]|nr:hypothetical protein BDV97DRAFT_347938 [Delphinella strobiligena]
MRGALVLLLEWHRLFRTLLGMRYRIVLLMTNKYRTLGRPGRVGKMYDDGQLGKSIVPKSSRLEAKLIALHCLQRCAGKSNDPIALELSQSHRFTPCTSISVWAIVL